MAYSLYDATVKMAQGALSSLNNILLEAETHPNSATFMDARLAEDMRPLTFQVYFATFQALALAAKLSGHEYTEPADDLDSYEKMHARVQQALDALEATDKDIVNSLGETMTSFTLRDQAIEVPIKAITGQLNMPNIYFHVAMAYAILRKEGVQLGKRNWSRGFVKEYV
jgi:hypothetical protein